ncbi:TMEM175 family protein [Sphingomonas sp. BN140010]|uniref:TMEM175 family protein n=1 Tax=Sphingomonas arvum TaxID=2992113 RepID=A0ABT3JIG3_9SPHN|nr:TMEM175 family protein [Sphingomonas sp. BN140010]MCW3798872.1 TMEM175 family protein [Sphingomonas sp. BN140010]
MADANSSTQRRRERPSGGDLDAPARRDEHEGEGATRGTSRMEAFADGVFAIAFTLPIFNVVAPDSRSGGRFLAQDLAAAWPQDVGYILASVIIGLYWVHHHFSGAIYRTTGHWFLIGTTIFLAMIGYIAFPSRIFADSLVHPAAMPAAARFLVACLALTSLSWLLKWNIGVFRGNVDQRLQPAYVARLNRRYWLKTGWSVAAALVAYLSWQVGLAMAGAGLLYLLRPPETPRYRTEAPVIEGD